MLREEGQKVITVTSTISGEGKTFCSTNLAAIFAMAGKKTLLIGLDLRRPKIHKVFNIDKSHGISTFLIGRSNFEDIIHETNIDNLFISPAGPIPPNPAELIESPRMNEFFKKAREQFDIIIIDTPPVGMVIDALLAARYSDVSLFILRQNYSNKNILDLIEEIYQKHEVSNMGILMNDIRHKGYYGYGYRYYNYGYGYSYGYGYYREYGE
jgi:capsular exopolysaccharide synthesis family protein